MNSDPVDGFINSITTSEIDGRKRRKLNPDLSIKTEVLEILQKLAKLATQQLNYHLSYETDASNAIQPVEHSSLEIRGEKEAPMRNLHRLLPGELEVLTQQKHDCEMKLLSIVNDWSTERKLVYGMKHQYSEINISFGNLNAIDKEIANFLLGIANSSDLKVFLASFNKTLTLQYDSFNRSGYELDCVNFEPDSDDGCETTCTYTLNNLESTDGHRLLTSSLIQVDMDNEVITEDCFDDIKPYKESVEPTGSTGLKICKYYRCAAIVMWPLRHFLRILKKYGASSVDIDLIFMNEVERSKNNEKTKRILLNWAGEILTNNRPRPVRMIKAIVTMENLAIIQTLFSRCVILNDASTSILESVCEKYGWKTFSFEISTMFNKLSKQVAIKLLTGLVMGSGESDIEKQHVFENILKIILNKCEDESQPHSAWYAQSTNFDNTKKREEEQEILLSICQLAERVSFNMLSFAKTKSSVVFVPVLLRLATSDAMKLSVHWLDVCQHFIKIMEADGVKSLNVLNWRQDTSSSCDCVDCFKLNAFLHSNVESIRIKMGKERRRHLHETMNSMPNIVHQTDRGGLYAILVITKTTKIGFDDEEKQKFSKIFLGKLRSIVPQ